MSGKSWHHVVPAVVATLLLLPGRSAPTAVPHPRRWVGVTMPSERLLIGAAQAGVIARMAVREGQVVAKGQILFQLTTKLEELGVERLRVAAASDADVREVQARLLEAEREEKRYVDLHGRGIVGDAELDQRRRDAVVARIQLERARVAHSVAVLRHQEAAERLAQRTVNSPVDGYVSRRFHLRGEPVEELVPVLEVVVLHPMWVEFDCPLADAKLLPEGARVRVWRSGPPSDTEPVDADVVFASRTADAGSQTFRIRLELRRRTTWKAGVKVEIEVDS